MLIWALLVNNLSLLITDAKHFPTDTNFDLLQNALLLDEDQEFIVAMNHRAAEMIDRLRNERLWRTFVTLKRRQGQMNPWERVCVDVKGFMDSLHALFEQRRPGAHIQ